jgi:hypothetical protein
MISLFPAQKKTTTQKNEKFYRDCTDACMSIVDFDDGSGFRASMLEKQINNDLANNILDQHDVDRVVNPWRVQGYDFPLEMRNYPLLKSKIDLLVGEERKRRFDWRIILRNADAINDKQQMIRDRYLQTFTEMLKAESVSEEDFKKKMQELNRWRLYEVQDMRERMATEVMTFQWDYQKMPSKFNMGYDNGLILGEEVYGVQFVEKEVVFERENPLTFHSLRSANSRKIGDSDIMVSDGYQPLGRVIDTYHEYLSDEQIDTLEGAYSTAGNAHFGTSTAFKIPENYYHEAYGQDIEIVSSSRDINAFGGAFDDQGNIRVTRCVWMSLRKMGKLKYSDPETGEEIYDLVDENYKPNKANGEEVDWFWGKEFLQSVKIGTDIYVELGPFPRIGTSIHNPSKCLAPFTGMCYTIGDNPAMSLMSYGRPYQYMFNATMHRTEKLVITSHGTVAPLPMHLIPDGWEIDDWLYYFSFLNFNVYDAFKEGNKGAAMGKLAGQMNVQPGNMNFDNSSQIQQNIMLLNMIKGHIDDLTGVSPQRQGQIEQRELVGNVERSVTQSSHITEGLFGIHEEAKLDAMELVLEATKYAWRNDKFTRQIVLSDMSSAILDFDGEQFNTAEYGIFFSNASKDQELFAALRGLAEAGLQSKMLKFTDIMEIYLANSSAQIRRKIGQSEEDAMQAQQQQLQAQQEQFAKQIEAQGISEDKALQLKRYIAELQEETKRMSVGGNDMDIEQEPDELAQEQMLLEKVKVNMEDKHHTDEMGQKDKDRVSKEKMHAKDIEVKKIVANKPRPAVTKAK